METEIKEETKTETGPGPQVDPSPPKNTFQPIALDHRGLVLAKNNSELLRYCSAMITSDMVPARFDTPQKLFGALMYVRQLGLPDFAIRQVANIKGVNSIFGDLPLALAQRSKEMTYFEEQWFDKNYTVICFENKNLDLETYGAVCFIRRQGNEKIQSFSFTLEDAKKAGLWPPKKKDGSQATDSPWEKYTKVMLRYKARTLALRSLFADALSGVSVAEADFDHLDPAEIDVTPPEKVSKLNEALQ